MNGSSETSPRFNALTDPWLPLVQTDGTTCWASPVEVLCGEKDGVDLDYPRDDFRVYARLLLSALVQALFPARNKAELEQRLAKPLARAEVEARIRPVLADFDLFGPTPFLQITPPEKPPGKGEKGGAPFVFPIEDLFQPALKVDAVCAPIALVTIFAEQTYAGGAGRGYSAGPGGQPGAMTLVDPGSIRLAAWANSLTLEYAGQKYAKDEERPWSNAVRAPRPRGAIGLVAGLFFQPRGVWLASAGAGDCSFTGLRGGLVRRSPLAAKSTVAKEASGDKGLWQHPCAPLAVNSQGIGPIRLDAKQPAWTGLAQLLRPLSKTRGTKDHPSAGPAPVLQQWRTLRGKPKRPRLLVLDFDRDKAQVKRRFFESFPLTEQFLDNTDVIERIRDLVGDAQGVLHALERSLVRAHDDRKQGGLALADARASFWSASEAPFIDWLAVATEVEVWDTDAERRADMAREAMRAALRKAALGLFDEHVSLSEFDPRKQARVAKARRSLRNALYPRTPSPAAPGTAANEVTA